MRRAALAAGFAALAAAWGGPMLWAWRDSVFAHMTAHMAVVAVAAPLIALGWGEFPHLISSPQGGGGSAKASAHPGVGRRRRSATRASASGLWGAVRVEGLDASRSGQASPFITSLPVIASLVELIVVWGWHAPAARAFAEGSAAGTMLEQAGFLAAGILLWHACLNGGAREGGDGAGAFGLLLTSVHMTLLGALLSLSNRPLYGGGEVTCFGLTLSADQDQQLGGVVMLLIGAAVYLAGGLALLARLLGRGEGRGSGPQEAAVPRGGGAPG